MGFTSTLLLLLWMRERLLSNDAFVIVENVPQFDHSVFDLLSFEFIMYHAIVSPTDMGFPCCRKRKYISYFAAAC